jgi:hypothetical protein
MYVAELTTGEWICSEQKKLIEQRIGRAGSKESFEKCKNLWFQPWNYLSGVMSDFFWTIKDNAMTEREIAMQGWSDDLPLSKCIEGGVVFLGKKEPKWYRNVLNGDKSR